MAEEKAYFKLLIDIYEINVSWSCREEREIKQVISEVGQHHLEQASSVPVSPRPLAGSELDLSLPAASIPLCERPQMELDMQVWELGSSPDWKWSWGVSSLQRTPCCSSRMDAGLCPSAFCGTGGRWVAWCWAAPTSWVSWFTGIVLCIFVPPTSGHIWVADSTYYPHEWTQIQGTSGPYLVWQLYMSKLIPVSTVTSKAMGTRAGSESCPLRHPSLAPCAVSGEKLFQCLQGIGTIYCAWPVLSNTDGLWQHLESELDPWWLAFLLSCWHLQLLLTSALATDVGI